MAGLGILFAGQGAQHPGMGLDWAERDPAVRRRIAHVSERLGYDLAEVLSGTGGRLDDTLYAQPAIVVSSHLAWDALRNAAGIRPDAFAGFSLGEWTSVAAARVLPCETVIDFVRKRAEAMKAAAAVTPGAMCAVIGLEADAIDALCRKASTDTEIVVAANYNCPGQIVLSGHVPAIQRAAEAARLAGAKRCVILNVSGAFHSPLMKNAAETLAALLEAAEPFPPAAPVYANVTALPYRHGTWKRLLAEQIVSPVRFEATLRNMAAAGITHFLEIGPGATLSGFVRKTLPEAPVMNLDGPEGLDKVKGWLKDHGFSE